jgi:proline iminopeptidase
MTPDNFTISSQMLSVGDGHSLYVQDWGNKDAKTTFLFLHGGPGSGCSDKHKLFFNPKKNRVIFFDQRGSGLSTPTGSLKNNTTKDQISDINKIADEYDIQKFVIVGGSWGSTLGLAYALDNPSKVESLVLRGLFTGSSSEIDAVNKGKFREFFPDVWDKFLERTPEEFRSDPSAYHIPIALSDDDVISKKSAFAMNELEGSIISLDDRHYEVDFEEYDPASTRIELSYIHNLCFMPDNFLLKNAHKITAKTWLIQGRYDAVCPPITAYQLSQKMKNSTLIWTTAGHSGNDHENFITTKAVISTFE